MVIGRVDVDVVVGRVLVVVVGGGLVSVFSSIVVVVGGVVHSSGMVNEIEPMAPEP